MRGQKRLKPKIMFLIFVSIGFDPKKQIAITFKVTYCERSLNFMDIHIHKSSKIDRFKGSEIH